jgi:uncharacterized peroxidase-related enzyme
MNTATRHFPPHTLDTAPEAARETMQNVQRKFGGTLPPAVARMATSPELLDAFLAANAFFERCSLAALERETLVMTVAVRNGCRVCIQLHTGALRRLRADRDLIDALRDGSPASDPRLAALQRFTHAVMDTAGEVSDDQLAAFTEHGFTGQQALEVVLGIGTYTLSTFANRLTGA